MKKLFMVMVMMMLMVGSAFGDVFYKKAPDGNTMPLVLDSEGNELDFYITEEKDSVVVHFNGYMGEANYIWDVIYDGSDETSVHGTILYCDAKGEYTAENNDTYIGADSDGYKTLRFMHTDKSKKRVSYSMSIVDQDENLILSVLTPAMQYYMNK